MSINSPTEVIPARFHELRGAQYVARASGISGEKGGAAGETEKEVEMGTLQVSTLVVVFVYIAVVARALSVRTV